MRVFAYMAAGSLFVVVRRVLVVLLNTLPKDHPFRVAQESVYRHLTDDIVRRSWRPVDRNSSGKARRQQTPMRLRLQIAAVFAIRAMPVALVVPAMLLTN